jgi:hypothetical protein
MWRSTITAAALLALLATSYEVAHATASAKNATAVAGSFTATAGSVSTKTCLTADNKTIVTTDGRYTGTATGAADLTGALTLRARSVVNTTDGVGTVTGSLSVDVASGKNTSATYTAVYDHGTVAGLAVGHAHDASTKLIANFSAAFVPGSVFTNGKLGAGAAGGFAVETASVGCKSAQPSQNSSAHGTISALSAGSITVAGLTCAIPADKSAAVLGKFKNGDMVQIGCTFANGATTLKSIAARSS